MIRTFLFSCSLLFLHLFRHPSSRDGLSQPPAFVAAFTVGTIVASSSGLAAKRSEADRTGAREGGLRTGGTVVGMDDRVDSFCEDASSWSVLSPSTGDSRTAAIGFCGSKRPMRTASSSICDFENPSSESTATRPSCSKR